MISCATKTASVFFRWDCLAAADGNSRFGHVLTSLPKPGGGEYGKYYSLPAPNDPRIGT